MAQSVKRLPAMRETQVQSLGQEDLLEVEMAPHSSILAWRIPMDRGTWRATVHGVAESQTRLSNYHTGLPGGSVVKNLPPSSGDTGSIPDPERSPMPQSNKNPCATTIEPVLWSLGKTTKA